MVRQNNKNVVIDLNTSVKKSNDLSLAKLNQGFTLNQIQLLSYAIFSTQKNGSTTFNKASFEKQFNLSKYATEDADHDARELMNLTVSFRDYSNDHFSYSNVFTDMSYEKGTFTFKWNDKFLPHILDLKERYIINDLTVTANFKSSFSWILYEYLKALYGYWHKRFTKEDLMELFNVEDVKSYQTNTSLFKTKVLDVAIAEINQHTELNVHYVEIKKGKAIKGFDIHWSVGKVEITASKELLNEIHSMMDRIQDEFKVVLTINDDEQLQNAIKLFRLINNKYTELNDSVTQAQAQSVYDFILLRMNELNRVLIETQTPVPKSGIFYNWLDERE